MALWALFGVQLLQSPEGGWSNTLSLTLALSLGLQCAYNAASFKVRVGHCTSAMDSTQQRTQLLAGEAVAMWLGCRWSRKCVWCAVLCCG